MHIHILGIGGTFMGGLAVLAREAGYRVTGCDQNLYPPMSDQLEAAGIEVFSGYAAEQLQTVAHGADAYIIGNALSRGNPLVEAILDQRLPYISGPQWLAENILHSKRVLAVAGTHGKTTTTSILTWILECVGLQPSYLIGGVPQNFGASARLTASDYFVIEADEYDTAFFDKRSKFVHYRPEVLLLNNLEYDHADIFPDLAAIQTQFHHVIRTVPGHGWLVVNGADVALQDTLQRGYWSQVDTFAVASGWAVDVTGVVTFAGQPQGSLQWGMLGEHNQKNALAAIVAAYHLGVPVEQALAALRSFQGVKRRLEVRGVAKGVTVYDDFAHHPTAIRETIAALQSRLRGTAEASSKGRIIAVFEPRSNTMKLGQMRELLAPSLAAADLVFCYTNQVAWDPAAALAPLGSKAVIVGELGALIEQIVAQSQPGDHVLIMSNGGFGGIHQKLLNALQA